MIDWTKPIELDDGTPLVLRASKQTELFIDIRCEVARAHPAFPIGKFIGRARRASGLVINNHKYHVRNRTMTIFKSGDCVRYTGKSTEMSCSSRIGATGTVDTSFDGIRSSNVPVRFDDPYHNTSTGKPAGVYPDNLELLDQVDLTKPLYLGSTFGTDRTEVKLVSQMADGNLLIDVTAAKKDSPWMIFDSNGKFVKSPTGGGKALSIANVERITHRFKINMTDGVPYFSPMEPGGVCDVQLITEDNKLVSTTLRADL